MNPIHSIQQVIDMMSYIYAHMHGMHVCLPMQEPKKQKSCEEDVRLRARNYKV